MKRLLLATVAMAASALFAGLQASQPAFACTGPGALEGMLHTELIFEGSVTALEPTTQVPGDGVRTPFVIRFQVLRGHRGVTQGQSVEAIGMFPIPGKPIMCPQFPQAMVGKYVIIGANTDTGAGPTVDAWDMVFIGDAPAGEEYDRAVRFVEMMADSNPNGPLLSFDRDVAACGEPLTFHGVRLPPGRYVVNYAFSGRIVAAPVVGATGDFTATTTRVTGESCRRNDDYHALLAFHLRRITGDLHLGELELLEVASISRTGAVDREPWGPELAFSPHPARCGENLTISGSGFEPGERLRLGMDAIADERDIVADASGEFATTVQLPGERCGGTFLRVWVTQSEFDLPGSLFSLTYRDTLLEPERADPAPTPGPPDLGSGLAFAAVDSDVPWPDVVMVLILAIAFAGGTVVIVRSVRRR